MLPLQSTEEGRRAGAVKERERGGIESMTRRFGYSGVGGAGGVGGWGGGASEGTK